MSRPLKIVVAGYAVGFPMGGQIWVMLHYLLGLARMGHDVLFLEDTSDWSYPFDPVRGYNETDSSFGRGVLDKMLAHFGLKGRWAYNSVFEDRLYGIRQEELDRFCSEADLLLNISGVNPLRENYMRCRVKAVIDTDPVFTQVKIERDPATSAYYKAHDACFTFGHNLPARKTSVPLSGIDWKPTLPPVLLEEWMPLASPGRGYTTIGSWDAKGRDVVIDGRSFSWRKSVKYEAVIDLPKRLPGVEMDLTFSGMGEDGPRFARRGWIVRDALVLSQDSWEYRDYIRTSRAEFTVAKDQNVKLKSGWFSDRSACYLASGRPVITEDTGFGAYLPTGEGLFTFETPDEAVHSIEIIESDLDRHRRAARHIAEEHFDARKVLGAMLRELDLA
jgi:glycosyltransferase involved in cell wall biosynthesis